MSEQASRESFLVRGENVGLWLPLALAVVGFMGALITAQLSLTGWITSIAQPSEPIAIEERPAHGNPPLIESGTGEGTAIADHVEASQAAPAAEIDLAVVGGMRQIPEEISTATGSPELPASEAAGREIEPSDGSAASASHDQAVAALPPGEKQTSGQQVESTPEPESLDVSTIAQATDDSPNAIASEPEAMDEAAPSEMEPLAALDSTREDAELPVGDVSDTEEEFEESLIDCAPLFSVDFNHGSTKPADGDIGEKVTGLAQWLNAHPESILYLDGHADSSGPAEANLIISFRRAAAVSSLLAEAGVPKARLVVRAYGEGTSSSPSPESEVQRRVTLEIDSGIPCDLPVSQAGGPQ